jgi:hypothetical protein
MTIENAKKRIFNCPYLNAIVFAFIITLISISVSCSPDPVTSEVQHVELTQFETIIAYEDNTLATPTILKYDGHSNLFVYDYGIGHILKLDKSGNIVKKIGQEGSGPGEFIYVSNMVLLNDFLFLVDYAQFYIHKFSVMGEYHASLDYGALGYFFELPPMNPSLIRAPDPTGEPYIHSIDKVMFSTLGGDDDSFHSIYEIRDWEGRHLAYLGKIPEGAAFTMDQSEYRNSITDREVPAIEKTNVFPINDQRNHDEIFLIYSSLPKIMKYNSSGEKLWKKEVPYLPEIDSVASGIYKNMENLRPGLRMKVNKYVAGTSTPNGDLYLAINSHPENINSLWIHRFNKNGELTERFNIESETTIPPIFDVDHENRSIFVITEEGEIRAYSF